MPIKTTYAVSAALKPRASVVPKQPYGEYGLGVNSSSPLPIGATPAPLPSTVATPASTAAPPISTPPAATPTPPATPPSATPPATPPATPTTPISMTGDPILARVIAFNEQQNANAAANALTQKKVALTQYGYDENAPGLYPDQNTADAAKQNPFSTLANLLYGHNQSTRGIDETTNNANLFYSGERVRELGQESHDYLGNRSAASSALARVLAAADQGVLDAKASGDLREIDAAQQAYQRALDFALKYGTDPTGGTGPGGQPGTAPGTTTGTGTPTDPFVFNPNPAVVNPVFGTPTPQNPTGINGLPTPSGGTPPAVSSALGGNTSSNPYTQAAAQAVAGGYGGYVHAPGATGTPPRGVAGAAATGGTPADPIAQQAAQTGGASYALVRNSTSLPGNQAPAGVAQAALYSADDPLAQQNVQANGGGFWVPSHTNETAQAYAARVNALRAANPGAAIMLDIEGEGKGYPGSTGYQWTQDVMAQAGSGPVSVTVPGGGEDDFNYAPFVQSGGTIWIQTYGATANDLMDPAQRYQMMLDRGIPANQIGLMLMPGQQPVPGVPYAYYAIEDFAGNYPTSQPVPAQSTRSFQSTPAPAAPTAPALTQQGYDPWAINAILKAAAAPAPPPAPSPSQKRRVFAT